MPTSEVEKLIEEFAETFPFRTRDIAEFSEKGKMQDWLAARITSLLEERDSGLIQAIKDYPIKWGSYQKDDKSPVLPFITKQDAISIITSKTK